MWEFCKKHWVKSLFVLAVAIFSVGYALWHGPSRYREQETFWNELGKGLGTLGFGALALLYLRGPLKFIVSKEAFWQRLEPWEIKYQDVKTVAGKLLFVLNKTHAPLGILAILAIFLHCYLTDLFLDNLLLRLALVVLVWQGIFGLFLKWKYTPAALRRKSYLFHSQLVSGLILLLLAGFGHLLL